MDLVYTSSNHYGAIPVTDTQTIANRTQLSHDKVLKHIRNHPEDFLLRGKYRMSCREMRNLEVQPYLLLNEAQVSSLFYYLKNTETNRELEMGLQRQFGEVKFELYRRRRQRAKCIAARQECIDLVRSKGLSASMDMKFYGLAYRMAFNKTKQEYRKDSGIPDGKRTIDYMSEADLVALTKAHSEIAGLFKVGYDYESIKSHVARILVQHEEVYYEFVGHKLINLVTFITCEIFIGKTIFIY